MAKIIILDQQTLEKNIKSAIDRKIDRAFKRGGKVLIQRQAEILRDMFANSKEYNDIKTGLVGEFGFTNEEVTNLDRILTLMVPGANNVTFGTIKTGFGSDKSILLEWVDFEALKEHQFAQHPLTRVNGPLVRGITAIVSWIDWLENGVVVRGFEFSDVNAKNKRFSRSGEGIMRPLENNIFEIKPSRVFERIGKEAGQNLILERGFSIIIKELTK